MPLIERTRPNVHRVCGKMFMPGMNILTNEEYEKIKLDSGFCEQCRIGAMKVVGAESIPPKSETVDEDPNDEGVDIASLNVKDASEVIAALEEIEDVKWILDNDARKGVQDACKRRIAELEQEANKTDIEKMSVAEAVTIIKKVLSEPELEKIKEADARPKIQAAVEKQLAELKNLDGKRKPKDGESTIDPNKVTIE